MGDNKDMIQEADNKIAYALRRTDPSHPEYSQAWADRHTSLQGWRQRLLGNE